MGQAYEALTPTQRAFWADQVAVHSYRYSQSKVGGIDVLSEQEWASLPPVEHPVGRVNDDSGRASLFIGRHASHLGGLPERQGRHLLDELCAWSTRACWVHRHRWQPGDAVLWDNRSVLHRGLPWPGDEPRVMKRTTVAGSPPSPSRSP